MVVVFIRSLLLSCISAALPCGNGDFEHNTSVCVCFVVFSVHSVIMGRAVCDCGSRIKICICCRKCAASNIVAVVVFIMNCMSISELWLSHRQV